MRYLLDTNVVSETRKSKPHGGVMAWLSGLGAGQVAICAVTFGELQHGIEKTRKQAPRKADELEGWVDQLQRDIPIIDLDAEACRVWARLMVGKPVQLQTDALIAAVALSKGFTVASRNVKDFARFSVKYVNPFDARASGS